MSYVPNRSYSYQPSSSLYSSSVGKYLNPGFGNVYQSNLGGSSANPMDSSLYTDYYSTTPALSLSGSVQAMYDNLYKTMPRGDSTGWFAQHTNLIPANYTGPKAVSMGNGVSPVFYDLKPGEQAGETADQQWARLHPGIAPQ